jgi:hypothetical protein
VTSRGTSDIPPVVIAVVETVAADTLLALFMALIAVAWAVTILDHAGLVSTGAGRPAS